MGIPRAPQRAPLMIAKLENVIKERNAGALYRLHVRSFSVQKGERIAITGSSGCGKSTTLDILGMVLRPDGAERFIFCTEEGEVNIARLWEQNRTDMLTNVRRAHMGYVLQTGGLFPFLRVEENIALTVQALGTDNAASRAWVRELMEHLEITRLRHAWPDTLSIGERQRVAIARALAPKPRLLLADEPTAALDPGLSRKVMELFLNVAKECSASVVMVSHDVSLVHEFAFREVPIAVRSEGDYLSAVLDEQGWV